jgi:DNA-binding XRE family transcriptional regulator
MASDPAAPLAEREEAVEALADILFPNGMEDSLFADRVCALLRTKSMNQRGLANAIGVTPPAISQILSGKHHPQRQTVVRIAAALGVRPEELLPT